MATEVDAVLPLPLSQPIAIYRSPSVWLSQRDADAVERPVSQHASIRLGMTIRMSTAGESAVRPPIYPRLRCGD